VIDPSRCLSLIAVSGTKPKSMNAFCPSVVVKKQWSQYITLLMDE
jgi:hypothetical protein